MSLQEGNRTGGARGWRQTRCSGLHDTQRHKDKFATKGFGHCTFIWYSLYARSTGSLTRTMSRTFGISKRKTTDGVNAIKWNG